jgi:hypothetical protein
VFQIIFMGQPEQRPSVCAPKKRMLSSYDNNSWEIKKLFMVVGTPWRFRHCIQ